MRHSGKADTFSDEDMARYKQAWANSGGWTGMINWYRALLRYRPPRLSDIRLHMPVLILWGKRDAFLSYEMAGESLKLCDHGKLIVYEIVRGGGIELRLGQLPGTAASQKLDKSWILLSRKRKVPLRFPDITQNGDTIRFGPPEMATTLGYEFELR